MDVDHFTKNDLKYYSFESIENHVKAVIESEDAYDKWRENIYRIKNWSSLIQMNGDVIYIATNTKGKSKPIYAGS